MSHPFPASKRKTSSRSAMLADDSSPRVLRPAPLRQAAYDAIIERLDGYLSRNSEDGAFTTEILIPQV